MCTTDLYHYPVQTLVFVVRYAPIAPWKIRHNDPFQISSLFEIILHVAAGVAAESSKNSSAQDNKPISADWGKKCAQEILNFWR